MKKSSAARRLGERTTTKIIAKIIDSQGCTLGAKVSDLSDSGARLTAPAGAPIPRFFTLRMIREERDLQAEMVWRKGEELGVRFVTNDIREQKSAPQIVVPKISLAALRTLAKGARG